jgi:hypothetical protein
LISVSVNSSTVKRVKETPYNYNQIETKEVSKYVKSGDKIAYGYNAYCPTILDGTVCFNLDDPGNITLLCTSLSIDFFNGGTWTNDWRWITCHYGNGILGDVNPCGGCWYYIGGGGASFNGISYDPVTEKLYGASNSELYEVNITSGEPSYIGGFGDGPSFMIGIAFDAYGVLYGWDVGSDNLWIIDTVTGEATLVGPLGIDLKFAQDGAFDYETDTLYLSTYTNTTGGQLHICDEDTGELTLVGDFQGGAEIDALAIPYGEDIYPPETKIYLKPKNPDGDNGWYVSNVTVKLRSSDNSCVNATYYRINSGEWQIIPGGWGNFIIGDGGYDILIDYYSVDEVGNIEEEKFSNIKLDQTSPTINSFKHEFFKKPNGCVYIELTAIVSDNISDMNRVEFYINDVLQETVMGPGPVYKYCFEPHGGLRWVSVKAFDNAGNIKRNEIRFSRSNSINIQQLTHPLILQFLDHFPLLHRLLDIWRCNF